MKVDFNWIFNARFETNNNVMVEMCDSYLRLEFNKQALNFPLSDFLSMYDKEVFAGMTAGQKKDMV